MVQGSGEFEPFLQRTLRREHERQRKVITALVIVIICALAAGILLSLLLLDLQKEVDDLGAGAPSSEASSDPDDQGSSTADVAGLRSALERLEVGLFGSDGASGEAEDVLGRLARQIDRTENSLARRDAAITCLNEAVTRLDEGLGRLLTRDLSAEDYIESYEIPDCS